MYPYTKRILDLVFATISLLWVAPLIVILGVLIRLDSPGPMIFTQTRIGLHRRAFKIYKLRTMTNPLSKTISVSDKDSGRITRVGHLLRITHLDELPQVWNVLRGEMSIVGPRPELPVYVERYRPEWLRVFSVRPGMVDLASLIFRQEQKLLAKTSTIERAYVEAILPTKMRLSFLGLRRSSLWWDLKLIALTAGAMVGIVPNRFKRIIARVSNKVRYSHQHPHASLEAVA